MSNTPPPGWYEDPQVPTQKRWWNGAQWTAHTHATATATRVAPGDGEKRWKPVHTIILAVGIVIIGCSVYFSLAALFANQERIEGARDALVEQVRDDPSPSPRPTYYHLSEHPDWGPLVARTDDMLEYYQDIDADTLYAIVPRNEEGFDYYRVFLLYLTDQSVAQRFGPTVDSQAAVDAKIAEINDGLTEMERRFLAGEDLDFPVSITSSDGSVFEHDGSAPDPVEEP